MPNEHVGTALRRISFIAALAVGCSGTPPINVDPAQASTVRSPGAARAIGYYDEQLRRVVLVGGDVELSASRRDRVWSWTGTGWELRVDSGPPSRANAAAAYDGRRRVAVVVGGVARLTDSLVRTVGETWQQATSVWTIATGTGLAPRDHHSLAYDETADAIVVFGGGIVRGRGPWPTDTWALRPSGWVRVAESGPAARARTALVYDRKRKQLVMFGGVGQEPGPGQPQTFYGDTWVWERSGWRKVSDRGPRGRYAHGMLFDDARGVVLLYGGAAAHRGAPLEDMWEWDGTSWTEIPLMGPTPGHRYQPVMVYDRARRRTVLYGGQPSAIDETWEWDGSRWTVVK